MDGLLATSVLFVVGVVGLVIVGLVLALAFLADSFDVLAEIRDLFDEFREAWRNRRR